MLGAVAGPAATLRGAARRARVALKGLAYSGPGRDRWQRPDRVLAELRLRPGARVADLGAGGGYFTLRLARAVGPGGVVYAVDTDPDLPPALQEGADRRGLRNVVGVLADPRDPHLPEPVDLVFLARAYHHIPDRPAYFARLARQLKPGGRLAVVEATPGRLYRLFPHATAPATIRSELEGAGYRAVAELHILRRQGFLVFERPGGPG
jgi:predicted methyltransferase